MGGVAWHAAVATIERRWWWLLAHTALWPALAVMIDARRAAPAARVVSRLLGCGPVEALRAPFIKATLTRQLIEAGQSFDEDRPVRGPGAAHVALARAACGDPRGVRDGARARGRRGATGLRGRRRALRHGGGAGRRRRRGAHGDPPPRPVVAEGEVVLWGTAAPLGALDALALTAPRPRPDGLW